MRITSRHLLFITIWLLCCVVACEYSPTGTNYRAITPPTPDINLVVLDSANLTALRGDVNISYQSMLHGHAFRGILLYLDDAQVASSNDAAGYVTFRTDYYSNGNHVLRIVLLTTTGSGSLAEGLGAEVFYAVREYPVVIYNGSIHTPLLLEFGIQNGALAVRWERYAQPGFKKYTLKRLGVTVFETSNVDQTQYLDSTIFGLGAYYELTTSAFTLQMNALPEWYTGIAPQVVSAAPTADETIRLVWARNPFYAGFGSYRVTRTAPDPVAVVVNSTDINDTTYTDPSPVFGGGAVYELRFVSPDGASMTQPVTAHALTIGTLADFSMTVHFEYIPSRSIYFQSSYNQSIIIDAASLAVLQRSPQSPPPYGQTNESDMSTDGAYVYGIVSSTGGRQIERQDNTTLATIERIDFGPLMPYTYSKFISISVSNNNLLAGLIDDFSHNPAIVVIDMNTRTQKAARTVRAHYDNTLQISDDGQYIIDNDSLYHFNGSAITPVGALAQPSRFANDNNFVIHATGGQIEMARCTDLQVVKSVPLDVAYSDATLDVDRSTGLIAFTSYPSLLCEIYDLDAGTVRGSRRALLGALYENGLLFWGIAYITLQLH